MDTAIPVRRTTPLIITAADLRLPAGDTWATFEWPAWVPHSVRDAIAAFWAEPGRNPAAWRENACASYYAHPAFGQRVVVRERYTGRLSEPVVGRWVPAWGNMGRIVLDDGTVAISSACYWHPINFCRDLGDEDGAATGRV